MDKQRKDMDKTQTAAKTLLRNAIERALESIVSGGVRFVTEPDNGPVEQKKTCTTPFYPAHRHNHIEAVFGSRAGPMDVLTGNKWRSVKPGELWVFGPGVAHSERARGNTPYDLLWIIPDSRTFVLHISAFRPNKGYFVHPFRLACRPILNEDQAKLLCLTKAYSKHELFRVHAILIEGLVQALKTFEKPASPDFSYQDQMAELVYRHIIAHFNEPLSLPQLALMVHYNPKYLNSLFGKKYGKSVYQCIIDTRMEKAFAMISETKTPIKEIAIETGFADPLYFTRLYTKRHGVPPSMHRARKQARQTEPKHRHVR